MMNNLYKPVLFFTLGLLAFCLIRLYFNSSEIDTLNEEIIFLTTENSKANASVVLQNYMIEKNKIDEVLYKQSNNTIKQESVVIREKVITRLVEDDSCINELAIIKEQLERLYE